MVKRHSEIEICIVSTHDEYTEAIQFIETQMKERFFCDPPPTTGLIFVARKRSRIVGSIVLQDVQIQGVFPIEHHYNFDRVALATLSNRNEIVQGSRWIATERGVSGRILHAACTISHGFGKNYMLIEAKPYSILCLNRLSVVLEKIPGVKVAPEKIRSLVGESGMRYFLEEPKPSLYLIDIRRSMSSMKE